jgi:hypothetical protein
MATNKVTIKAAVFAVLPEAKLLAGVIVACRTLYYKVRPLLQKRYGILDVDYKYFSTKLLPAYQREAAQPLEGVYYKARGELHHPHDDDIVQLGTREVEAYIPPNWQFDKVLYIEKTGLSAQLDPYQIGQRYDMAIIYGEGYAVEACRNLLAMFKNRDGEQNKMTIFTLHDADLDGYDIERTLRSATRRMPDHHIEVIDIGLTAEYCDAAGMETETFHRTAAISKDLELGPVALRWFTGEPLMDAAGRPVLKKGKQVYECTRCELNAFSADQLAAYIVDQLAAHGAVEKLVPPADVLARRVETDRYYELHGLVSDIVDIDGLARALVESEEFTEVTEQRVRDWLDDHPTESWRAASEALVQGDLDVPALTVAIHDLLASPR